MLNDRPADFPAKADTMSPIRRKRFALLREASRLRGLELLQDALHLVRPDGTATVNDLYKMIREASDGQF